MNRKKIVSYLLSMVMVISTLFSCVNPVKAIGNVEYTLYAPSNDFQRNIIIVDTEDIAATYELENLYVDNNVIDKTAYNFDGKKIQFHDFQLKKMNDGIEHNIKATFSDGYSNEILYQVFVLYDVTLNKVAKKGEDLTFNITSEDNFALFDITNVSIEDTLLSSNDYTIVDDNTVIINSEFLNSLNTNEYYYISFVFLDSIKYSISFLIIESTMELLCLVSSDGVNYEEKKIEVYLDGSDLKLVNNDDYIDMTYYAKNNLPMYIKFDPNEIGEIDSLQMTLEKQLYTNRNKKNEFKSVDRQSRVGAPGKKIPMFVFASENDEIYLSSEVVKSFGDDCFGNLRINLTNENNEILSLRSLSFESTFPEINFDNPNADHPKYPWNIIVEVDEISRPHYTEEGNFISEDVVFAIDFAYNMEYVQNEDYSFTAMSYNPHGSVSLDLFNQSSNQEESISINLGLNVETKTNNGIKQNIITFTKLSCFSNSTGENVDLANYDTGFKDIELNVPYIWEGSIEKETLNIEVSEELYCNGIGLEPIITIHDGDYELVKGKDYIVNHANNLYPGIAQAIITGIGDYSGTKIVEFEIKDYEDSDTVKKTITFLLYDDATKELMDSTGFYGLIVNKGEEYLIKKMDIIMLLEENFILNGDYSEYNWAWLDDIQDMVIPVDQVNYEVPFYLVKNEIEPEIVLNRNFSTTANCKLNYPNS